MKIQFKISLLFIGLLMIFSSCNCTKKTKNESKSTKVMTEKTNKVYIITVLNGKTKLVDYPTMHINFIESKISGNSGCNQYGGDLTIENNAFKIGRLMATKMYCSEKMHVEKEFLGALGKVVRFEIKEKQIFLYEKAGTLLVVGKEKN